MSDKKKKAVSNNKPFPFFHLEYNNIKFIHCFLYSGHHVEETQPNVTSVFLWYIVLFLVFSYFIIDNYISPN